jgi:hypothetical protein
VDNSWWICRREHILWVDDSTAFVCLPTVAHVDDLLKRWRSDCDVRQAALHPSDRPIGATGLTDDGDNMLGIPGYSHTDSGTLSSAGSKRSRVGSDVETEEALRSIADMSRRRQQLFEALSLPSINVDELMAHKDVICGVTLADLKIVTYGDFLASQPEVFGQGMSWARTEVAPIACSVVLTFVRPALRWRLFHSMLRCAEWYHEVGMSSSASSAVPTAGDAHGHSAAQSGATRNGEANVIQGNKATCVIG